MEVASFNPDLLGSYQSSDLSDLDLTSVSSRYLLQHCYPHQLMPSLSAVWLLSLVVGQGGWQDLDNFLFEWVLTDEPSVCVWPGNQ